MSFITKCDISPYFSDQKNVVFFTIKTDNVRVSADAVCRITGTKNGSCKIVAATSSGTGVSNFPEFLNFSGDFEPLYR